MNKLTLCFAIALTGFGLLVSCGESANDGSTQSQALGHGAGDDHDGDDGHACRAAQQAAQASKPHKVSICHIPPGNPDNAHTINVSKNAVRAHLAHGDVLDGCGCTDDDDQPHSGGNPNHGDDDDGTVPSGGTSDPTDGNDPTDGHDPNDGDDPTDPAPLDQPDDGGTTGGGDVPPNTGSMCDSDQLPCAQDAECGNNQACDATSHCCVDVFL